MRGYKGVEQNGLDWSYIAGVLMIVGGLTFMIVGAILVHYRMRHRRQDRFAQEDRYFLELINDLAEILRAIGE